MIVYKNFLFIHLGDQRGFKYYVCCSCFLANMCCHNCRNWHHFHSKCYQFCKRIPECAGYRRFIFFKNCSIGRKKYDLSCYLEIFGYILNEREPQNHLFKFSALYGVVNSHTVTRNMRTKSGFLDSQMPSFTYMLKVCFASRLKTAF